MKKDFKKFSKEELENVSGGACQIFSKKSYDELGFVQARGQSGNYHPLIVTCGNLCSLYEPEDARYAKECANCRYHLGNIPMYCLTRSKERDFG